MSINITARQLSVLRLFCQTVLCISLAEEFLWHRGERVMAGSYAYFPKALLRLMLWRGCGYFYTGSSIGILWLKIDRS